MSSLSNLVPFFTTFLKELQLGHAGGSNLKSSNMVVRVFFFGYRVPVLYQVYVHNLFLPIIDLWFSINNRLLSELTVGVEKNIRISYFRSTILLT